MADLEWRRDMKVAAGRVEGSWTALIKGEPRLPSQRRLLMRRHQPGQPVESLDLLEGSLPASERRPDISPLASPAGAVLQGEGDVKDENNHGGQTCIFWAGAQLPGLEWWAGFDLAGALREPVPTWTATPPPFVKAVADVIAAALRAVAADPASEAAWARLLLLPRLLFAAAEKATASLGKYPRHSGPGLSGARFEHWAVLRGHEEGTQALTQVLVLILEGRAPEQAMRAILAGRLLPLLKPGGGVRPLACGETLRRMAAKAATAAHKNAIAEAVGHHQFGVGRKNGIELMHRVVAATLEKEPGAAVLSLDVANAFNELCRDTLLREVAGRLPELAQLATAWYGGATTHGARLPAGREARGPETGGLLPDGRPRAAHDQPGVDVGLLVSKALSLGVIAGSFVGKLPQVHQIWKAHSAHGVSAISIWTEAVSMGIQFAYNVVRRRCTRCGGSASKAPAAFRRTPPRTRTPLSTYAEVPVLFAQMLLLAVVAAWADQYLDWRIWLSCCGLVLATWGMMVRIIPTGVTLTLYAVNASLGLLIVGPQTPPVAFPPAEHPFDGLGRARPPAWSTGQS
ncbi:unnamed protein product [Prorocentrum cordatum]|uniref:Reverse transcriptase domain-containing protein n=1 Tax=Prorocentrum cordatum TaxID=2364126 RepID=A0ABN9V5X8_9DINO|nr:unnamed protein product [Polarella glacialis]